MTIQVTRYHDISCGHILMGHTGHCSHLHGHNYRFHLTAEGVPGNTDLDAKGMVVDFAVIKSTLCAWLEAEWDHKFLIYFRHPWATLLHELDPDGVVRMDCNPTAENLALTVLTEIGPLVLAGTGVRLVMVRVEETAKCSATVLLHGATVNTQFGIK